MNPVALVKNIRHSLTICPTWSDRLMWLRWMYGKDDAVLNVRLQYSPPIGKLDVMVRRNRGADAFIFGEVFEHRYYDFDLPCEPKTILDLGGNVGFSAIYFGRKYAQASLACVEPVPENFALLRQNISLNRIVAKLFEAAIAVEQGQLTMDLCDRDYGHQVSGIGPSNGRRRIDVRAVTVPIIMEEMGWDHIDLLKIDIEGYERELLTERSEWLDNVKAIAVECHEGFELADLNKVADRHGFRRPVQLPGIHFMERI
jgi:FkbM family methyltransferase